MMSQNSVNSGSGYKTLNKRSYSSLLEDDVSVEKLDIETEAEKHLKTLLDKQLNKTVSIKEQFAQHRTFSCPSTYTSPTELIKGACTLDKFKEIEENEEAHQELQRCGLSDEEIADYLSYKSGKEKRNGKINPSVWRDYINALEQKIKAHNEELLKPQEFRNVKKLTRHEMEIEKSLYAGCPEKSKLATLVSVMKESAPLDVNSAYEHIKNMSQKLLQTKKKKGASKKMQSSLFEESSNSDANDSDFLFDPNIHHVVIPVDEEEIKEKRLSADEIRQLPKFENYKIGNPSKTLYLKNLHPKVTVNELRSLFCIFESENKIPIDYRLCTGRMKGQAFVKFSCAEIAEKALNHVNGYSLIGKPVVIAFGLKN